MKTSELTGAALNWAVAMAEGEYKPVAVPAYSTDWAQGGAIIERERISVCADDIEPWCAFADSGTADDWLYTGTTPLIAAMRCYVASKLGNDVEIPEGI